MMMRVSWVAHGLVCCVLALSAGHIGCKSCGNESTAVDIAELPEVPTPAHHAADLFIAKPEETFFAARKHVGGAFALLPATFPSMVVSLLGLPPQMLDQIDGRTPVVGVLTDDGSRQAFVVGIHVRDGVRTVQLLTQGSDAKYAAKHSSNGMVLLEPKPTLTSQVGAMAVAGSYILVAEKTEYLVECGPYVTGTLSKRKGPDGDIAIVTNHAALKGPIAKRIRGSWASFKDEREQEDEKLRKEHGRQPDFGEPAVVLADVEGKIESIVEILSDLDQAVVRIDVDEVGIHTWVGMTPLSPELSPEGRALKAFSSLAAGDVQPLLAIPLDSVAGVLMRDDETGRVEIGARQAERIVALLGERAKEKDKQQIRDAMSSWSKGRGQWLTVSVQAGRDEMDAVIRGLVADPADPSKLDQGIRNMVGLLDVSAVREPLEHHIGKLVVGKVQKVGSGALVHVDRNKKVRDGEPPQTSAYDVAWKVYGAEFEWRTVRDGKSWLALRDSVEGGGDGVKPPVLGDNPIAAKVLGKMGSDTSFLLYLDPQLFVQSLVPRGAAVKEQNAPLVLAYGGDSKQGWFKVVLSHAAAREIVKMLGRREP